MSAKRVAVLGASGQLGTDVVKHLRERDDYLVDAFSSSDLDVTDADALARQIAPGEYDAVINTAALTNVDLCEEQGERAVAVNATGAYLVARACAAGGAKHLLIGTDFVFAGDKAGPYEENDLPHPVNVYGASKLFGEALSALAAPDTLILRISSVFGKAGSRGKGGNFVEAILGKARAGESLKVVGDITMSPTYTVDVARALPALLDADASGVVHLANSGSCTWFEFAQLALTLRGHEEVSIERVTSASFPRPAKRPRNSALASDRLEGLVGCPMRPWQEALKAYLEETS